MTFKERLQRLFRINKGQDSEATEKEDEEIVKATEVNTQRQSNLQKQLKQLATPYKETEAYKIFGRGDRRYPRINGNPSVFWDTRIHYVQKYENAPLKKNQGKEQEGR